MRRAPSSCAGLCEPSVPAGISETLGCMRRVDYVLVVGLAANQFGQSGAVLHVEHAGQRRVPEVGIHQGDLEVAQLRDGEAEVQRRDALAFARVTAGDSEYPGLGGRVVAEQARANGPVLFGDERSRISDRGQAGINAVGDGSFLANRIGRPDSQTGQVVKRGRTELGDPGGRQGRSILDPGRVPEAGNLPDRIVLVLRPRGPWNLLTTRVGPAGQRGPGRPG